MKCPPEICSLESSVDIVGATVCLFPNVWYFYHFPQRVLEKKFYILTFIYFLPNFQFLLIAAMRSGEILIVYFYVSSQGSIF